MFVQMIEGRVSDREGLHRQMDQWMGDLRPGATGFLGSTVGVTDDGYGIAFATKPEVAGVLSQLILFIALMFAPINYPAERLPSWLANTHDWLPFTYMAQVVRETINVPATGVAPLPFAVLALWSIAGLAVTYRVMTRRS